MSNEPIPSPLDARMTAAGITNSAMARTVGCTSQHIWRVRKGTKRLSPHLALKIETAYPKLIRFDEMMRHAGNIPSARSIPA